MPKKLLIFSFSPVQGFIFVSRRPRDLFTGSYIISYLTQRVIKDLGLKDKVIYPMIEEENSHLANYPNKFIAVVEGDVCDKVEGKFREIWKGICEEVWKGLELKHAEDQFWKHVDNYFNPVYSCLEFLDKDSWEDILGVSENLEGEPYAFTYDLLERLLGAKKSWRPYRGVVDAHTFEGRYPDGCTMCGERLHLAIDWRNKEKLFKEKDARHIRDGERLCGVCLVKRFAVKYYFKNHFGKDLWHSPSTEEVAGINFKKKLKKFRDEIKEDYKKLAGKLQETPYIIKNPIIKTFEDLEELDAELFRKGGWEGLFKSMKDMFDEQKAEEIKGLLYELVKKVERKGVEHTNSYYAIMISDGDSIGEWLGIKSDIRQGPLREEFHRDFSKSLSEYAKEITQVENPPKLTIYAGGDDTVAFLHPFDAVKYAKLCNEKFRDKLAKFAKEGKKPSISSGILITHAKMNLQKALDDARSLEKQAKGVKGKGAVCIGVLTRSGSLTSFVSKWEDLELYEELLRAFMSKSISSTIVYELRPLAEKFGEESREDIFFALIKKVLKRKVEKEYRDNLYSLIRCFYERSKTYTEDKPKEFAIRNLLHLFYVARFVGTLEDRDEGV